MTTAGISGKEWALIRSVFDELLDWNAEERTAALRARALPEDIEREVSALLAAADSSSTFLEHPTAEFSFEAAASQIDYSSLKPGAVVGVFSIERMIGRGGSGEVYLSRRTDGVFDQTVALKLLRPEAVSFLDRFRRERQILANLEHPGIARLIDGGAAPDGRPYIAMEFVAGSPITEYARQHDLRLNQRLELFQLICAAVAYAHRNLVVHRDLKPGNVLVTGEGQPKLLDFGIASILDESAATDQTMALLTPQYAAPEQFEGRRATTATDVYALGAILFELLSDKPAWTTHGALAAVRRTFDEVPRLPSAALGRAASGPIKAGDARGDLDAIVRKAMRAQPDARYESAQALSDDIGRHLANLPVLARKGQFSYRVERFVRRNRGRLAAAAAVLFVAGAGGAGYVAQSRQAEIAREAARLETARGDAVHDYVMLTLRAAVRQEGGIVASAKQTLDRATTELAHEASAEKVAVKPQASLLRTIAQLQMEIGDMRTAEPLLEQAARIYEQAGDSAALAQAHQDMAFIAVGRGELGRAEQNLQRARAFWASDPNRFSRQLVEATAVEAALLRARGEHRNAIMLLDDATARARRLFGDDDEAVSRLLHNRSVHLIEAGRVEEAAASLAHAWRGVVAQGRTRSLTAFAIQDQQAAVALRRGDAQEAERLWRKAITLQKSAYGPSMALAVMQLNLARLLLLPETAAQALELIEEAFPVAQSFSGETSGVAIMLRQSRSLALALQGKFDEAKREVDVSLTNAERAFGPGAYTGLALTARAQIAVLSSDFDGARIDLAAAKAMLLASGDVGKAHIPALDVLERTLGVRR
jgi:tetratricopeptide (TPR) repeat protein/predicted Ser/Thr protein kinase